MAACGHSGHHAKGMCKSCYDKAWKLANTSGRSVNIRISIEDHDEVVRFAKTNKMTRGEALRTLVTWGLDDTKMRSFIKTK